MENINCKNAVCKIDVVNQAVPFMYWKRFSIMPVIFQQSLTQYFTFPLDAGFGFIITEMFFKSQSVPSGMIKIEFVTVLRSREYQLKPFYPRLISTPADQTEISTGNPTGIISYINSPSPVDNGAMGRSATATNIKNRMPLFILYHYQENVMVKIKMDSLIISGHAYPSFCDVVLSGYQIPEKTLTQWK